MTNVHLVLAAIAVAGCARTPKDSPAAAQREPEAPGSAAPESRFAGTLAGHRFTITVEGGQATGSSPEQWSWSVGAGHVAIQEIGEADADTRFLVARSPRTIVRGEDGFTMVTEVVLVAGGRAFRCTHEERVADPDSPDAKDAVERGIAACSSLRVEP